MFSVEQLIKMLAQRLCFALVLVEVGEYLLYW
jgi:hypothetical protein